MIQPLRYGSRHTARQLTLPHDYQYDDAQPESRVSPAPIFGESLGVENADDKIEAYGQWLTSSENPRFTKVIANRMWKKIFGRGLVEPVDDWRDDTQASIPELLDHLEKLMVRVNYDLKEFQRVLLSVQAFDREAVRYELTNDQPHFFEGPVLKRMSAEQLWDSFVSLSIPYSDERIRDPQIIEDKLDRFAEYQEKSRISTQGPWFPLQAKRQRQAGRRLVKWNAYRKNCAKRRKPMIGRRLLACAENTQKPAISKGACLQK